MNIKPTGIRLLVAPIVEKHKGLIHIPEAHIERATCGEVVAVGPKVEHVVIGDRVLFNRYAGTPIESDGRRLIIMTTDDIVAVANPEPHEPANTSTHSSPDPTPEPVSVPGSEPPTCTRGGHSCTCECG